MLKKLSIVENYPMLPINTRVLEFPLLNNANVTAKFKINGFFSDTSTYTYEHIIWGVNMIGVPDISNFTILHHFEESKNSPTPYQLATVAFSVDYAVDANGFGVANENGEANKLRLVFENTPDGNPLEGSVTIEVEITQTSLMAI